MDWTKLRGFNYQPSYGTTGLELWLNFDAGAIERELAAGKRAFPHVNGLRWWLSWDAFNRDPRRFVDNFDAALKLADSVGCGVMPVLFNRWHDSTLDYGGIYIDHFLPGASWVQKPRMFDDFMDGIVASHADDPRIMAWDLCNEPFAYGCAPGNLPDIHAAEKTWLAGLYEGCKSRNATAPVTVGVHQSQGASSLESVESISDVLNMHAYYSSTNGSKEEFETLLEDYVAIAKRTGKALICTECCWGSLDDTVRVETMLHTLDRFAAHRIGWLAYILHYSRIADAHGLDGGPVGGAGNLMFLDANGAIRPGHEIVNAYMVPSE